MVITRLLNEVVLALKARDEVEGILWAGEAEVTFYLISPLPVDVRRGILAPRSTLLDLGNERDDGELNDGTEYCLLYQNHDQQAVQLAQLIEANRVERNAICLWNQLTIGQVLFDRGRLAPLKQRFEVSYPDALKRAVVKKNWPLVGPVFSHRALLAKALKASDWVDAHRHTTAFLDSAFDLVFAANGKTHPGRRLAALSLELKALPSDWAGLLSGIERALAGNRGLVEALDTLSNAVEVFLVRQGLIEAPQRKAAAPKAVPATPALASPAATSGVLSVYTDGGCIGNPGKGAWAFLVDDGAMRVEDTDGDPMTTNNKMELQAVISALSAISIKPEWKGRAIRIHTDSQYVRNGITAWIKTWASNGWKTAAKEPVKNQDLWMELQKWDQALKPEWKWVKGHAGNPNNERCDALVRRTMDQM